MVDHALAPSAAPVRAAPVRAAPARGHLRVLEGIPTFSALPHAVMRDTAISRDARLLYAILQGHWWRDGICSANHTTLAAEMGCTVRSLREYLNELIAVGLISEEASGSRRQKVYRPASNTPKTSDCDTANTSESSDSGRSNRKVLQVQSEDFDRSNRTKPSDSKKKTPVKKKPEDNPPSGGTRSVERAATPSGALIDLLKAADIPLTMRAQDHKALKDSGADPALVAEAYGAIFRGEWGDDFMRRGLSVQFVIGRLAGFQAWKRNPSPPATGRNGSRSAKPASIAQNPEEEAALEAWANGR